MSLTADTPRELRDLVELAPEMIRCPYPAFDAAREAPAVHYVPDPGFFVVAGFDDVVDVLRRPAEFSNHNSNGPLPPGMTEALTELAVTDPDLIAMVRSVRGQNVLAKADPPEHTRQRRLVNQGFTPRRIALLEPHVREIAEELVEAFADGGAVELSGSYAMPIPMRVIAETLGVPVGMMPTFKRWSDHMVMSIGNHGLDTAGVHAMIGAQADFYSFFAGQIADRRAHPRDDLITDIVRARTEDDQPLTDDEMLRMCGQFMTAGNETTTKLISGGALLLCEQPELWAELKANPDRIPLFVEEALRLLAPVQGLFRTATADVDFHGVHIPAGSFVWVLYAAANRDPAQFPEPWRIDLDRANSRGHVAFGLGPHFCLGANLARLEARIAFETLLSRFDRMTPLDGVGLHYENSYVLRGLAEFHVELSPAQ